MPWDVGIENLGWEWSTSTVRGINLWPQSRQAGIVCINEMQLTERPAEVTTPDLSAWTRSDLTMGQFAILLLLSVNGPMSMGTIAEAMAVTSPTVTGIVKRLRAKNLVYVTTGVEDERSRVLALTSEGEERVADMIQVLAVCGLAVCQSPDNCQTDGLSTTSAGL